LTKKEREFILVSYFRKEGKVITWTKDKEVMKVEAAIAKRASSMATQAGFTYPILDATMDIDACHNNDCQLKLYELLEADDFNFAYDVFGIRANIDRTTGKLQNCFLPRYSQ